MRSILLCLIITFILFNTAYSQSIQKSTERIADTIKAEFLRNGLQPDQIDTFIISGTEMVSDRDIIIAEIETSQIKVKRCIDLIKLDSVYIAQYEAANKEHTERKQEIQEANDRLAEEYTKLKQDSVDYKNAVRSDDTLAFIFRNADTVNKENYKTLMHMVISTQEGKINVDAWVYLDKNYNIGTIEKREN